MTNIMSGNNIWGFNEEHRQILVRGPEESKLALQYLFLRAIGIAFRINMINGGHEGNFFSEFDSIFLNCIIKVRRCPIIPLANIYGEIFEEKMSFMIDNAMSD